MTPLEKLNAAAARLIQMAGPMRDHEQIRIKEIAATIRGAVATIRTALEGNERKPQHPRFGLIVGDEARYNEDDE
jgi:hypothetical protein